MCCGVVHRCSHTAHNICILDAKIATRYKDVSEHNRDCNGNNSAHVQGRRQLDLVISGLSTVIQHLPACIMINGL